MSYLPDYSFFHLMNECHLAILLDDLKVADTNIARIKNKELKIPITELTYFNAIQIEKNSSWKEDHLKALRITYGDKLHFKEIYNIIEKRYNEKPKDIYQMKAPELLVDICFDLIVWIKKYLDIACDITFSSKLGFTGFSKNERCLLMLESTGTTKLRGHERYNWIDSLDIYETTNIDFQMADNFSNISIIEDLFEKGKECLK